MSSAFIQAAIILLREGLEAMLGIAALAGYLTKAGAGHRIQALYGGALAAVPAVIVAAWLFAVLNSGEHSDVLEGVIILIAAALMLYVSGWLLVKQDTRGWEGFLGAKAGGGGGSETGGRWRRIRSGRSARWPFWRCFVKAPRPCCSSTRSPPPRAAGAPACSQGWL